MTARRIAQTSTGPPQSSSGGNTPLGGEPQHHQFRNGQQLLNPVISSNNPPLNLINTNGSNISNPASSYQTATPQQLQAAGIQPIVINERGGVSTRQNRMSQVRVQSSQTFNANNNIDHITGPNTNQQISASAHHQQQQQQFYRNNGGGLLYPTDHHLQRQENSSGDHLIQRQQTSSRKVAPLTVPPIQVSASCFSKMNFALLAISIDTYFIIT